MPAILAFEKISKRFGAVVVARALDLALAEGEALGIIGPNGAGKTTLFNLISGRFPITSGSIMVNGQSTANLAPQEINRLGLSRSFQITSIFPRMSVFENLQMGATLADPAHFQHDLERLVQGRVAAGRAAGADQQGNAGTPPRGHQDRQVALDGGASVFGPAGRKISRARVGRDRKSVV